MSNNPRTTEQIWSELDNAQVLDRTLKLGTPEYMENRQRIGKLIAEYSASHPVAPYDLTPESYDESPDSFEQSSINRNTARLNAIRAIAADELPIAEFRELCAVGLVEDLWGVL